LSDAKHDIYSFANTSRVIILAWGFTEIASTPSRFASSRKNIYTVVSGKPANDLQTNMCNSTALTPGPVAGTISAFQTCSQTELSNNIYTLLTWLLKIFKLY